MKIRVRNRGAPQSRTVDRGSPELEQVGVFKSELIGPKRSRTPQGYLFCEGVPIARTGEMFYGDGEIPITAGPEGFIRVTRGEDELFNPDTMASFVGMPVTDEHPPDGDVSAATWRERAYGFVLNVRRGEGEDADCIVCDLMITDPSMILDIDAGKREVSAGYDAKYIEVVPGRGIQAHIMGNHVALVERGRCGPRCAIGDSAFPATKKGSIKMPSPVIKKPVLKPVRRSIDMASLRRRVMDAAEEAINTAMEGEEPPAEEETTGDGGEGGGVHVHIHHHASGETNPSTTPTEGAPGAGANSAPPVVGNDNAGETAPVASVEDRLAALETGMQQILNAIKPLVEGAAPPAQNANPPGNDNAPPAENPPNGEEKPPTNDADMDEDEAEEVASQSGNTMDSESLATVHANTKAMAEVLFPGFAFPEFNKSAPRSATQDAICGARRRALDMAYSTTAGKQVIDTLRGGTTKTLDVKSLTCVKCAMLFKAAAGAMKLVRARDSVGDVSLRNAATGHDNPSTAVGTPAWWAAQEAATKEFWNKRKQVVQ